MSAAEVKPRQGKSEILLEQFIPDHVFVYVKKGEIRAYDGNKSYHLKAGEYYLVRKNRLVRYDQKKSGAELEKTIICFDENFLKSFQDKHRTGPTKFNLVDTFISVKPNEMTPCFIRSLQPYYDESGNVEEAFSEVKYEELLLILLRNQPELAGILFDYGIPGKLNLEEFMNSNYQFNISLERFAFLTGRSLSAFKRDFRLIFNETPNRWLVQKRLQEAYFLIDKKNKKPSEIYFELGFEDLSHFSFAFKKLFKLTPTKLAAQKKNQPLITDGV